MRPAPEARRKGSVMEECRSCRFYREADPPWQYGKVAVGSCQRRSPIPDSGTNYNNWPAVTPGAWCGEYEAAPERGA